MSRFDDNRREELREMTRTALATALTGAAAGLSAAAKALHSTAQQIRPPTDEEPSQPSRSQTAPTVRTPASAPPGKGEGTAAARARARAAAAREEAEAKRDRASQPAEPTAPAKESAPAGSASAAAPAAAEAPRSTDPAMAELADRPVRGLLSELDRLNPDQLRALRAAEVAGKHRKTVIEAIDRKL